MGFAQQGGAAAMRGPGQARATLLQGGAAPAAREASRHQGSCDHGHMVGQDAEGSRGPSLQLPSAQQPSCPPVLQPPLEVCQPLELQGQPWVPVTSTPSVTSTPICVSGHTDQPGHRRRAPASAGLPHAIEHTHTAVCGPLVPLWGT